MFYVLSNGIKEDESLNVLLKKDDIDNNIKYLNPLFPNEDDVEDPYNSTEDKNVEFKVCHLLSVYKFISS